MSARAADRELAQGEGREPHGGRARGRLGALLLSERRQLRNRRRHCQGERFPPRPLAARAAPAPANPAQGRSALPPLTPRVWARLRRAPCWFSTWRTASCVTSRRRAPPPRRLRATQRAARVPPRPRVASCGATPTRAHRPGRRLEGHERRRAGGPAGADSLLGKMHEIHDTADATILARAPPAVPASAHPAVRRPRWRVST
jgi:hypothetical protein